MKFNFLILLSIFLIIACSQPDVKEEKSGYLELRGYTQGTTYQIVYKDSTDITADVEMILSDIDQGFNLWDSTSVLSRLNAHSRLDTVFSAQDTSFNLAIMFEASKELYEKTNYAFNPTVLPLLELWNFGKDETAKPSEAQIDSVLQVVGFSEFDFMLIDNPYEENVNRTFDVRKTDARRKLDFNAIVQGYTADLIASRLDELGINDYMINIGGELKVKGKNVNNELWSIGIQNPSAEGEEAESIVQLTDCAIATSGNYRNFKIIDGQKYSHTIDGRTGYPVSHNLLSCTVIAKTAYEADAYATAFMVMGTEGVHAFLAAHPELELEVYLIYDIYGKFHVTHTPEFPLAS